MALHLPPPKPSQLQLFVAHLELALEARFEIAHSHGEMTPADALKACLDSVAEARREMGW